MLNILKTLKFTSNVCFIANNVITRKLLCHNCYFVLMRGIESLEKSCSRQKRT